MVFPGSVFKLADIVNVLNFAGIDPTHKWVVTQVRPPPLILDSFFYDVSIIEASEPEAELVAVPEIDLRFPPPDVGVPIPEGEPISGEFDNGDIVHRLRASAIPEDWRWIVSNRRVHDSRPGVGPTLYTLDLVDPVDIDRRIDRVSGSPLELSADQNNPRIVPPEPIPDPTLPSDFVPIGTRIYVPEVAHIEPWGFVESFDFATPVELIYILIMDNDDSRRLPRERFILTEEAPTFPPAPPGSTTPVGPPPPTTPGSGIVGPILELLDDLIGENSSNIIAEIVGAIGGINSTVDELIGSALNPIDDVINVLDSTLGSGISGILEGISGQNTLIGGIADSLTDTVSNLLDDGLFPVLGSIDNMVEGVSDGISGGLFDIGEILAGAISSISSEISGAIEFVGESFDDVASTIGSAVGGALDDVGDLISIPLEVLAESIPLQIAAFTDTITSTLEGIELLPEFLADFLETSIDTVMEKTGLDQVISFFRVTKEIITSLPFNPSIDEHHNQLVTNVWPQATERDTLQVALYALPIIGSMNQLAHPALPEIWRQRSLELERPTQIGAPDVLELIRRFPEETDEVLGNLRNSGFSETKINQMLNMRFQLPGTQDLIDGWRRGFIDNSEFIGKIRQLGWADDDVELIQELATTIPPVQDLILFAVRGVFDVEESRAFGEFEGLPPSIEQSFISEFGLGGGDFSQQVQIFADAARQQGIPEWWTAAYWTSHWRLPALQTAYQMFQRLSPDIIDAERDSFIEDGFNPDTLRFGRAELDRLVRASDFSEFWRDKLTAIAYQPLTRVDIRRMHALGLIDRDQVKRSYRKNGFSPSDAELMTQFTEAFNDDSDPEDEREIRDLTRVNILDLLEGGYFTEEEAIENLFLIGYERGIATAFVQLELASIERKIQKQQIALIEDSVKADLMTVAEAHALLSQMGIPASNIDLITRQLSLVTAVKTRQPSRQEMEEWHREDVMTDQEYLDALVGQGYTDLSAGNFLKTIAREPTLKQIDEQFVLERMDEDRYRSEVKALGFSSDWIERLLRIAKQKLGVAQLEGEEE